MPAAGGRRRRRLSGVGGGTRPAEPALEQAADWFARLRDGDAAEHAAWQRWLAADAEHRRAWSLVERVGQRFAPLRSMPEPRLADAALQAAAAPRLRRRSVLLGAAALAGSGSLGAALWRDPALAGPLQALAATERSAVGELRTLALADGSRVWMASASALDAGERRLRLYAGELLVQTAAGGRPFVAAGAHGRVQAMQARFALRIEDDGSALVAVQDGELALHSQGGERRLQAGEQRRFGLHGIGPSEPADPAREAWTRGLLIARATPLAQVVAELQRWNRGRFSVAAGAEALPVFGSYPLRDAERTLAMLSSVMPIGWRRVLPGWTRVEPLPRG